MEFNSALCCIIKDENYLEQFIIYYHLIGVEHFYIYDNQSKIPIIKRLNHYFFKNICTIFEIKGNCQQMNAYNHCISYTKNRVNWLLILDGDEFIYLKKHKNINQFLDDYKDYYALGLNWLMFGSSFHEKKQKGLIIDKYTYCENNQNQHIKTICKPKYVTYIINPHYVETTKPNLIVDTHKRVISGPFNKNENSDIAVIYHYWGKSMEDMEEKIKRGRAPTKEKRKMPNKYHGMFNKKCNNELKNKFSKRLKDKMNELDIKIN